MTPTAGLYRIASAAWMKWESLFHKLARIRSIDESESYLFHYVPRKYMGKTLVVDGVPVHSHDQIIELHMNNDLIFKLVRESKNVVSIAVRLVKEAQRALPALANIVASDEYENVKILMGVTFIHRGVERLGFQIFPIQNRPLRLFTTLYLRVVFRMINPRAFDVLKSPHAEVFVPMMVVMSRDTLLQRYGDKSFS